MKNGLYTEKELIAEADRTGYTLSPEPEGLISSMDQHGMLKEGIDDKILKVLILQFCNSTIGRMDIANPPIDPIGAPVTQAEYEEHKRANK